MSEPISPEEQAAGAPERLHPLFLLTGLGGSLRGLAGGYVAIGYLALSGRLETAIIGAIALLLFVGVGIALYWTRFKFLVGRSDIRIDSGIVSRRHRSIPFDRIQDVDITQGPVARLLGIAQVKFETGGGAVGPNAEEAVLHAIPLARAHEIRELVRVTRSSAAAAAITVTEGERPPTYRMDLRRLLLAGTFNFSLAVVAGLFGLTQTAGDFVGFDPLNRTFWTGLVQGDAPIPQFILQHRAGAAVAGLLLLLVIGAATGIVRTVLMDHGFRLDRTDAGLRRRRGLLTRTDVSLPAKRAQAAIVATGPLRDRFGWRQLKLQNLARDEGGSGDHVLAPLATDEEVNAILTELGWRRLPVAVQWTRVSPAYVWVQLITIGPPLLIVLFLFAAAPLWTSAGMQASFAARILPWVPLAISALLLAGLTVRWLAWRRTAYTVDGDRVLIRTGWWRRRLAVLPIAKIQSIDLSESFISRLFGIARLRFGVAGGGLGGHSIPTIPRPAARQLRDQLLGVAA